MKAQFNLQINRVSTPKKGKKTDKPASVSVIPPSIPAKFLKKVVEISRFFKKKIDNKEKKSYAQALFLNSNPTRETLKIKEVFPNLQNKKLSVEKTNQSQS